MVVGGSGLYIKALVDGLFESPPADQEYRDFLWKEEAVKGPGYLHNLLAQDDPASGDRIHPNNIKRVIRALEVLKLTGVPISRWQKQWSGGKDERRTSNSELRTSNVAGSGGNSELGKDEHRTSLRQGYGGQAPNQPSPRLRRAGIELRTSNDTEPCQPSTVNRQPSTFFPYLLIGLRRERKDLYNRINLRVLEMFDLGLVDETRELLKKGLLENRVACRP